MFNAISTGERQKSATAIAKTTKVVGQSFSDASFGKRRKCVLVGSEGGRICETSKKGWTPNYPTN